MLDTLKAKRALVGEDRFTEAQADALVEVLSTLQIEGVAYLATKEDVAALGGRIDTQSERISSLSAQLAATDKRLDDFATYVDKRFDDFAATVDQRFDASDSRMDRLEKRLETVEARTWRILAGIVIGFLVTTLVVLAINLYFTISLNGG